MEQRLSLITLAYELRAAASRTRRMGEGIEEAA